MIEFHQSITRIDQLKGMIIMATTTEIATALDTTPRTLRKFMRKQGAGVGKGARYALPSGKRDIAALRKQFDAWREAQVPTDDDA
jgi:hypothetical protein